MQHPDTPDQPDPDLNGLFARLREAPPPTDPARVALGFETRVLARVRASRAATPETLRWFWRWSAVFGAAAIVCVAVALHSYQSLDLESLAAFDDGLSLLDWFY
jgi:hypothetical protein